MNTLLWGRDVTGPEHDATFEMLKDAGFEGVEVGIFDANVSKYERLGRRLAELGLEPIGVCRMMFDTFHAHIEEKDLRACADVLVHVHASENDRSTPGAGQVDCDALFAGLAEIGYDGWISIEAFGGPAAGIWRPIFAGAEQLARDGAAFVGARL